VPQGISPVWPNVDCPPWDALRTRFPHGYRNLTPKLDTET